MRKHTAWILSTTAAAAVVLGGLLPALAANAPAKPNRGNRPTRRQLLPVTPLIGADLSQWRSPTGDWFVAGGAKLSPDNEKRLVGEPGTGVILNGKTGTTSNLISKREHGDVTAHIEFMVPKGSNSGVYFQGRYEVQVLDSWKVEHPKYSDCGGIYERWGPNGGYEGHAPRVNASRAPGQWQSFDVEFRAPRFDAAGKKIANARFVKVAHNGVLIHENVEVTGPTRAATFENDEKPLGPLMLQGDHGPVAYRNIQLTVPVLTVTATRVAARARSMDDEAADLPPSHSVKPELYATGFEFAEGPAFDAQGNLFVVNYRGNGNIGRIMADGTASVFCNLREAVPMKDRKPQANGLKVDRQGRIVAADAGGARVLRISPDGKKVEILADGCDGKRFQGVNDVALDPAGNIYVSDPGDSSAEKPTGDVYRIDAATGKVRHLDGKMAYPNGLGVTPDGKHLVVGESWRYCLTIWDLAPDGTVSNRRTLIQFPEKTEGNIVGGKQAPDGLILDAKGRVYVAIWSGGVINVVDVPSGKLLRQYDAGGKQSTNCHFHGGYLYTTVAAKEAVFRLKLGVAGHDYNAK